MGGAEWRVGQRAEVGTAVGELVAVVNPDTDSVQVRFAAMEDGSVHVARLGGGIVSEVRAGENRGRRLEHEFVLLATATAPLREGAAVVRLPAIPDDITVSRDALAVWISRGDDPRPVQATGGWLVE